MQIWDPCKSGRQSVEYTGPCEEVLQNAQSRTMDEHIFTQIF